MCARVQRLGLGNLVDIAPVRQDVEEIGLVGAHDRVLSVLEGRWFNRSGGGFKRGSSMTMLAAIGLMSGTSYDGVDVALIDTDGEAVGRLGPTGYRGYSDV